MLKLGTNIFIQAFDSDYFSLLLRPGISLNSIWDSGVNKNKLPEGLCRKRGWSKNSLDIAMDDFDLLPIASFSTILKLNGNIFPALGSAFISFGLSKPITKNPFIRYSPIDISFGFGNN